jgi:hypothetical protein
MILLEHLRPKWKKAVASNRAKSVFAMSGEIATEEKQKITKISSMVR